MLKINVNESFMCKWNLFYLFAPRFLHNFNAFHFDWFVWTSRIWNDILSAVNVRNRKSRIVMWKTFTAFSSLFFFFFFSCTNKTSLMLLTFWMLFLSILSLIFLCSCAFYSFVCGEDRKFLRVCFLFWILQCGLCVWRHFMMLF